MSSGERRHLAELPFERRVTAEGHVSATGTGQRGGHHDGGIVHLGQRGHGEAGGSRANPTTTGPTVNNDVSTDAGERLGHAHCFVAATLAAARACPSRPLDRLARRSPNSRKDLWCRAKLFCPSHHDLTPAHALVRWMATSAVGNGLHRPQRSRFWSVPHDINEGASGPAAQRRGRHHQGALAGGEEQPRFDERVGHKWCSGLGRAPWSASSRVAWLTDCR